MLDSRFYDLAVYRLDKAQECLKDAYILLNNDSFTASANRSYYAIFHSARALLALDGEDRKKHSGVIAYFQENYIKNGIFDKIYSYIIQNAFSIRQDSDYEDFYVISKDDAKTQAENAEKFISKIKEYVDALA